MLMRSLMILIFFASTVQAATVVITDNRCVPHTAIKVHESLTNYWEYQNTDGGFIVDKAGNYLKNPDGTYVKRQLIPFNFKLGSVANTYPIDMVKSKSSPAQVLPGRDTDDNVVVELQPVATNNTALWPKLYMNCVSHWTGDKFFTHECKQLTDQAHFALDDFHSEMTAQEGGADCSNGSRLKYTLTLVSNTQQVELIKQEAVNVFQKKYPLIFKDLVKLAVNTLFNEEDFFRTYYTGFYERWVASIPTTSR
jgi:hypothetical protein